MAQAADQHIPSSIERSLDDYLAQLIATLGCAKYPALWEMWERIATRRLLFIRQRLVNGKPYMPPDGKPYNPEVVNPSYFRSNYTFDFDRHDRVQVVALKWRREGTGIVAFARPFDLDYLGAKIAEQHSAVGPREYSREIKHADAFERSHDGLLT